MDTNKERLSHSFLTPGNWSQNGDHGGLTPITILWLSIRVNARPLAVSFFSLCMDRAWHGKTEVTISKLSNDARLPLRFYGC